MASVKIKLNDATNIQLDWLVAELAGLPVYIGHNHVMTGPVILDADLVDMGADGQVAFAPSTDYGLIGKLCHERGVSVLQRSFGGWWATPDDPFDGCALGAYDVTPQRAACKALLIYRADALGLIDVPEELL